MEKEVDLSKEYRTRSGCRARLYEKYGSGKYPIHGAVYEDGEWIIMTWMLSGKYMREDADGRYDLIEVKPRIKRTFWVNVYPEGVVEHETKEHADKIARKYNRLACVKIELDCEEGDGL